MTSLYITQRGILETSQILYHNEISFFLCSIIVLRIRPIRYYNILDVMMYFNILDVRCFNLVKPLLECGRKDN